MTTPALPRYVIDASVAVKWILQDEPLSEPAQMVLDDFEQDRISLLAPDHLNYEVANAIRSAVRQRRIAESDGLSALQRFLALAIPTVGGHELLISGFSFALRYSCALYDGLYASLADQAGCSLLHADRRLHNTLGGGFSLELWVENYRPPNLAAGHSTER